MGVSFNADRKDLLTAVEDAARGCGKLGYVSILKGLLVVCETEQVHFDGTDVEIRVRASCPAAVKGNPGSFVLGDAKRAAAMLKTLDDGEVAVSATSDTVTFQQGSTMLRLDTASVEDFPKDSNIVKADSTFEIRTADFLGAWKRVGKMFSGDMSRPVLTAVHVKAGDYRVVLESTDSYRLAFDWVHAKVMGAASALVPGETLELVSRFAKKDPDGLISFTVDTETQVVAIEVVGVFITTRIVQGQFPDVHRLIPDKFEGDFDLDSVAAVKACRRVEKLKGRTGLMRLVVPTEPGTVRFYTLDGRIVDTDQTVPSPRSSRNQREFEIGLNAGFFAEAIESMGGDLVTVKYINPLRPLLVVNGKEDAGVLQMPIKIA